MSRQMPNSMEAEQALLGAMLVYEKSVRIAIDEGCRHQDFYLEAHRKIYRVMEVPGDITLEELHECIHE